MTNAWSKQYFQLKGDSGHTSTSPASYGVSFVIISEKSDGVRVGLYCIDHFFLAIWI